LKLNGCAYLYLCADSEAAGLALSAEDSAYQEIAGAEGFSLLVEDNSKM
tara:strand:- start:3310 stop:3456 length:147 start_codon:yes stop_codon:yes gene_type:complete